ncbi:MAG: apolipoprotein N-acyltransferase [Rubrivivax sp.]|nr:apolipoprotein N-acyltransferase [Rubrivivax sp.]
MPLGIAASAVLSGLYAQGGAGWALGFVALVPWLLTLTAARGLGGVLLNAWAMSVGFTAAVFPWFGSAIARLAQIDEAAGLAILLLAAPLFQPQFLVFAITYAITSAIPSVNASANTSAIPSAITSAITSAWARAPLRRAQGEAPPALPALPLLTATAAWVAAEWIVPKLLGDTLGHGLYPARLLRQAADVGGAAGLTLLLLLANIGIAVALGRRRQGVRSKAAPLVLAALVPAALATYGAARLATLPAPTGPTLRVGLVQSNLVDYERLRRERGSAAAVVREVLDTHYAMSHDAVERQRVHAVLWSETVYPTTFARPKSEAGAELDQEIAGIVNAAGVPFVFGTYDRDGHGEYNAAAFMAPGRGLVGFYRKTRPFPLTEFVPAWLEGPWLREWLPWAGTWRAGNGARVMPLFLADGREVPVLPLICLDAVDSALALEGARLGATAILTMSNDSWFTERPLGAQLHQAVAAFRSIETRLPQFRVTSNGFSAVIDATGSVQAGSRMGERTLVVGELPVATPPRTLMVAWGDWVGRACAWGLALAAVVFALVTWSSRRSQAAAGEPQAATLAALPAKVVALPRGVRPAAAALRLLARGSLLWMAGAVLFGDTSFMSNTLAQLRTFAALFLAPEVAAMLLLWAFEARPVLEGDRLVLTRRDGRRAELAMRDIAAVEAWRLPLPVPGAWLRLASGERWPLALGGIEAFALAQALARAAAAATPLPGAASDAPPPATMPLQRTPAWATAFARARAAAVPRGMLSRPVAKFLLLPGLLAVPAFRLHQHIAYGGALGELQTFGVGAFAAAFALWWAAWVVGVALCAAVLRAAVEAGALAAARWRPALAVAVRRGLERAALLALYAGLPAWLLWRITI